MAKRTQPAAAKSPPGERAPADRWWRSPTVMAAIIAAVAAVSVALIQLSGPKAKPPAPPTIEQQTHGPGSPAVGHTGGNVTIQQQQGDQKP
jgi:hypothetical protein